MNKKVLKYLEWSIMVAAFMALYVVGAVLIGWLPMMGVMVLTLLFTGYLFDILIQLLPMMAIMALALFFAGYVLLVVSLVFGPNQ